MDFRQVKLYVITCPPQVGQSYENLVGALCEGGADAIQFRDKTMLAGELVRVGKRLVVIARRFQVLLIVNDRPDVALAIDADGVHLGQDDLSIAVARRILGPSKLIGRSTHSLDQALQAEAEGADYIAIGPIFTTPTKPEYPPVGLELIGRVQSRVGIPVVAIGGIDAANLDQVLEAGAVRVAVVRAVCAVSDPEAATRTLKGRLLATPSPPGRGRGLR
ncbi:MAG: thiamine phosphate synthase [Elusimicrobia bacterium]|nr:thiamine phosphate synthase [Elusimicrobiota bacterium]